VGLTEDAGRAWRVDEVQDPLERVGQLHPQSPLDLVVGMSPHVGILKRDGGRAATA